MSDSKVSDETRKRMSESHLGEKNGMYGKNHSDETREIMSLKATGRKQSADTVRKKAEASRGTKREKQQCSVCLEFVAVNMLKRWHGDKCKMRQK